MPHGRYVDAQLRWLRSFRSGLQALSPPLKLVPNFEIIGWDPALPAIKWDSDLARRARCEPLRPL